MSEETCEGCCLNHFEIIATFHSHDLKALKFFKDHGMLPSVIRCPTCKRMCLLEEERFIWRCSGSSINIKKNKRCEFSISVTDFKGSILYKCIMPPWKLILFINDFVYSGLDSRFTGVDNLKLSSKTIFAWEQFCCKVTDAWLSNQHIGGPGIVVEIGEGQITSASKSFFKQDPSKPVRQIRVFGGIEPVSKKFFVTALTLTEDEQGECLDRAKLLSLLEKFVAKDSVVYSANEAVYKNLNQFGYTHVTEGCVVTPTLDKNWKNRRPMHSLTCFWRDLNRRVKKPEHKPEYLNHYIALQLFMKQVPRSQRLHQFLVEAARLYPPQINGKIKLIVEDCESKSDEAIEG